MLRKFLGGILRELVVLVFLVLSNGLLLGIELYWPTEDKSFFQGIASDSLIQPTVSGKIESGKFGCVRNDGNRFHEGIDIKPKKRNKKGEAIDKIVAAMDGDVVYINQVAGNSSYGKYIVIIHKTVVPAIYTLYAHLSDIEKGVTVGKNVKGGEVLGIMGRTSLGKPIPKERAHLHFEMGVMLSEGFAKWYDKQKFTQPNKHGIWNGFNLTGFDALDFYEKWRGGKISSVQEYFNQMPIAFTLRVFEAKMPDFLRRYPELVIRNIERDKVKGWDIDFTWFAMPVRFTPFYGDVKNVGAGRDGKNIRGVSKGILVKAYNNNILNAYRYKDGISIKTTGNGGFLGAEYGKVLRKTLDLLFE